MSNINNSLKINGNLIMGESNHTHDDLMKIKGDTKTSINFFTNWSFYCKIFEVEKFIKNGDYITYPKNVEITWYPLSSEYTVRQNDWTYEMEIVKK